MNKKVILIGLLAAAGVAYAMKNKKDNMTEAPATPLPSGIASLATKGQAITYANAPGGAVWFLYNGQRYAFVSGEALYAAGFTWQTVTTLPEAQVSASPSAGWVDETGVYTNNGPVAIA